MRVVEERLLAFSLYIYKSFDLIERGCVTFVTTEIKLKNIYYERMKS